MYTRWIHGDPANLEKAASSIDSIVSDANRASEIIKRVQALSMRAEPKRSWIEINVVIREVLGLLQSRFRKAEFPFIRTCRGDLPMIFGDRIQLQQVALNLLVNAIDAMGTLQSSVREIRINSAKSSASGVMITIETREAVSILAS